MDFCQFGEKKSKIGCDSTRKCHLSVRRIGFPFFLVLFLFFAFRHMCTNIDSLYIFVIQGHCISRDISGHNFMIRCMSIKRLYHFRENSIIAKLVKLNNDMLFAQLLMSLQWHRWRSLIVMEACLQLY